GNQRQPVRAALAVFEDDAQPVRLEPPFAPLAANADPLDRKQVVGEAQGLAPPRAAIAEPEGEVDQPDIETEKAADRPRPDKKETDADRQANDEQKRYQHMKAVRRQAAMRQQHPLEEHRAEGLSIAGGGDRHPTKIVQRRQYEHPAWTAGVR